MNKCSVEDLEIEILVFTNIFTMLRLIKKDLVLDFYLEHLQQ